MQGWMWDEIPRPKDTSSETGYIIFDIKIDADGNAFFKMHGLAF